MDALVPDDLWAVIEPLLPPEAEKPTGGRPRASDRAALAGILSVLRTGMQWKHLPRAEVGCGGKTSWRRLGAWQAAGVWAALHRVMLERLQDDPANRIPPPPGSPPERFEQPRQGDADMFTNERGPSRRSRQGRRPGSPR